MSNPWDDEPTPITDRKILNSGGMWNFGLKDAMQEMEKKLLWSEKKIADLKHTISLLEEKMREEGILPYGN